jgi:hypothetical protein
MDSDKYIWCRNCNEIHHVTPFDRAPLYASTGGEQEELSVDDWRVFMNRHAGHKLEGLRQTGEAAVSDTFPDPMSEKHVAVTNGQSHFVLRSFRTRIDQPLAFELMRGRFEIQDVIIEAQEREIRNELKKHFPWPAAKPADDKIDLFVALFAEIVSGVKIENLRASGMNGSVEYGRLEARVFRNLLANCAPHFTAAEFDALGRFVEQQQDLGGVLAVRVQYRYGLRRS